MIDSAVAGVAARTRKRGAFHLGMAVAISLAAFAGFSITYFGPLLQGRYPSVSATVHVHGWSFFAWYLLLPLQAGLVRTRRMRLHRALGAASVGLAAVMILTGLTVVGVQVDRSMAPGAPPFWRMMGPGVFSTLLVFTVFYASALRARRRGPYHKRFMVLASAGALGAATFRLLGMVVGPGPLAASLGIVAPNLFVVAAMMHDLRREGAVHRVYRYGLPITLGLEVGMMLLSPTPGGDAMRSGLAWIGRFLAPLYL